MTRSSSSKDGDSDGRTSYSIHELDEIDMRILSALTTDARNTTSPTIADKVDVTPATIRNRIENLVSSGVIKAHRTELDYRALGLLEFLFICTVDPNRLGGITDKTSTLPEVVQVREYLNGSCNLHVVAVVETQGQAEVVERRLADLNIVIEEIGLVGGEQRTPFSPLETPDERGGR